MQRQRNRGEQCSTCNYSMLLNRERSAMSGQIYCRNCNMFGDHVSSECPAHRAASSFTAPTGLGANVNTHKPTVDRETMAREAILQDLRRRWKENRGGFDGVIAPADISRFYKPQTNYFCGAGVMACPICQTGKLKYSRSTYNGHVHARCSTAGCVAWME